MNVTRSRHGWVHMFITHRPSLKLQLHNFDFFRTCRRSSLCTVAWQLARFQLTRRITRSLGDSWASWLYICGLVVADFRIVADLLGIRCTACRGVVAGRHSIRCGHVVDTFINLLQTLWFPKSNWWSVSITRESVCAIRKRSPVCRSTRYTHLACAWRTSDNCLRCTCRDFLLPRDAMLARYSLCYGAVLHSLVASDAASDTDNCTSRA